MPALKKIILFASMALPFHAQPVTEQIAAHARAAQEAERRNDFPRAVREYEYVVGQLPRNAEMQSNLGVALYFDHQLPQAIAVFHKAVEINPNLLAPHLFSGLAWYRLSNPNAAVPELQRAVHLNPSDGIARTWLGYAYVAQFRYEPAIKEFRAVCQLQPDNIDVWYALGQSYLQVGKDATLKLLAIAPDGGRTWQLAGEQLRLQGDRQKALKDFQGAIERRPDIPELRALVSDVGGTIPAPLGMPHRGTDQEDTLYRQAHNAEQEARAAFQHVVQIAPDSYRAHQIMADAFAVEQQSDKAIEEYRTVLKLKPDLPGIHEAIGNSLYRSGKLPEALKEFESELQIQPRSATARMDIGRALLMLGKNDDARKMLTSALQMDRPPLEIYSLLGKLDLRRHDYRGAIAALTHYVSIDKDDSNVYYLLSRAYRAVGDQEQMNRALDLYRKTSQGAKERSLARKELERLDDKNQDSEEALERTQ